MYDLNLDWESAHSYVSSEFFYSNDKRVFIVVMLLLPCSKLGSYDPVFKRYYAFHP